MTKNNFDAAMQKLALSIGSTDAGWAKAAISNTDSVIVKPFTGKFELVATQNLIKQYAADRLVMLPPVKQNGVTYMVLTYPGAKETIKRLLANRVAQYTSGEISSVFGTDSEIAMPRKYTRSKVR